MFGTEVISSAFLKEAHPEFYEKGKLADTVKLITARLARIQAARDKGEKGPVFTEGFSSGLEPGEAGAIGGPQNFPIACGLGIQGPRVGLLESDPVMVSSFDYSRMLPDLSPDGTYWVEFWYRDTCGRFNRDNQQQAYAWIAGEGLPDPHVPRTHPIYLERTFGQWRKLGFKIKAPQAADGRLQLSIKNISGLMEIAGILIRPVSDRQNDSLISFLEGMDTP